MSTYFPKFCMCTLLVSLFSYKPLLYSCLTIYHLLILISNALLTYNPVVYMSHLLPLNIIPSYSPQLLLATLFRSFLSSNNILCTTYYPIRTPVLCTVFVIFSPEILLIYFVSPYHYISLSLTFTFLSNYTLVISSTQMPIRSCLVPLSAPQPNFSLQCYIFAIHCMVTRKHGSIFIS
jgi:hypothetical protein